MASNKCIVHSRLTTNDLDILRQMCEDITLSLSSTLKSRFSSNMNKFLSEENDTTTDEEESQDSLPITQQFYPTFINKNPIRFHRPSYLLHRNVMSRSISTIKYESSIYYELPKRCCSCNGKKGLNVIDLNVLINICDEISLDKSSETINLSFEPETDSRECHRRISRFIGKKGQNLNTLQDKYDVGIHITNGSSNKAFKRNTKLENVAKLRNIVNLDKLDVLIRRKHPSLTTDTISMDEIKQELNAKWKEASEFEFIQKELSFDHNHFQFVCLSFESERSLHERREIIGRFIGKKGENLRSLEDQYNIRLHIMNDATFNRKHIQKIVNEQNENNFYFLSLLFESEISLQGRRRKISRFIGKNGEHIRGLQDKYNIRIQIVDQSFSRKIVQKKFAKIQDKDKLDKLYLLVTNKNKITTEKIRIVKIKEDINKLWENEEEINNLNHTQSSELNFLSMSSIQLNSDNRWNKKFFMSLKSYCTHSICIFRM
ncbi:unnamed protein product [Adineta steineri]|uniref:K Homology domain-containing protein n=1 Tax=Adineta steineri TaxID=433720 RepID=A0A819Z804_9BILA|nr:unnamed protein product [Adineta steineri]